MSRPGQVAFKISNGISIYRCQTSSSSVQLHHRGLSKRPLFVAAILLFTVTTSFLVYGVASHVYSYYTDDKISSFTENKALQNISAGSLAVSASSTSSALGLPTRLKIPIINVDVAIESVGLTPQGAVDVPKGATDSGWFNASPRPGENGSSVIDGHYGWWKNNTQGVFNNLNKLRKGNELYVTDETGATITFIVRESRIFEANADAAEVFSSKDGAAHLNLITCDGVWDATQKSYSSRLVVFTDKKM